MPKFLLATLLAIITPTSYATEPVCYLDVNKDGAVTELTKKEVVLVLRVLKKQEAKLKSTLFSMTASKDANSVFRSYFGVYNKSVFVQKKKELKSMLALNKVALNNPAGLFYRARSQEFSCSKKHLESNLDPLGAVISLGNSQKVLLFDAFFKNPKITSYDASKARAITHEMSHIGGIVDNPIYSANLGSMDRFAPTNTITGYKDGELIYGARDSLFLSKERPELALIHADSISYYFTSEGRINPLSVSPQNLPN